MNFKNWIKLKNIDETTSLSSFLGSLLTETTSTSARYSVEVTFRSKISDVLDSFAKICLGYVSAALKQNGYHVKQVYDQKPIRILVSSRNWDDGEWVGVVNFNHEHEGGCFVVSKGFYNKDRKSVSIQSSKKCSGDSAAQIVTDLRNLMHNLKGMPDRHHEKIKGVPLKRGPKN